MHRLCRLACRCCRVSEPVSLRGARQASEQNPPEKWRTALMPYFNRGTKPQGDQSVPWHAAASTLAPLIVSTAVSRPPLGVDARPKPWMSRSCLSLYGTELMLIFHSAADIRRRSRHQVATHRGCADRSRSAGIEPSASTCRPTRRYRARVLRPVPVHAARKNFNGG